MIIAALIGAMAGVLTLAFLRLLYFGIEFVWTTLPALVGLTGDLSPLFIFAVAVTGGLTVGLLVRLFGDQPALFAELMAAFGKTGRIEYRHVPGILLNALVSLISGGALGPEAPLMDATGSLGTWIGDRLKITGKATSALTFSGLSGMLGAFFSSPFAAPVLILESAHGGTNTLFLFPGIIGAASAIAAFMLLGGAFFSPLFVFAEVYERVRFIDLVYAIPLGLPRINSSGSAFAQPSHVAAWKRPSIAGHASSTRPAARAKSLAASACRIASAGIPFSAYHTLAR